MATYAELSGRTVLITGGANGIGQAMVEAFHVQGATVSFCDMDEAGGKRLAKRLAKRVEFTKVNLSREVDIKRWIAKVAKRHSSIDVLINNAGVAWGAPLGDFPEAGWDKVMDTNVKGPFFLTQQLLPLLEAAATFEEPARIVNVGSIDGIKTPIFDNFSYGPSKAAIHHLTRVLAAHLIKRNIIVNGIAPGPFPTWMLSTGVGGGGDVDNTDWDAVGKGNPRGRVGQAEDIAGLAIFLSSKASGFTVGDVITCDGGSVVS